MENDQIFHLEKWIKQEDPSSIYIDHLYSESQDVNKEYIKE